MSLFVWCCPFLPFPFLVLYISKWENLNQSMKNTINQSTDHSANCHLSLPWSFCQLVECEILNWSINQSINHWIYQSINQLTNHSESIKWKITRFTALLWKPWLINQSFIIQSINQLIDYAIQAVFFLVLQNRCCYWWVCNETQRLSSLAGSSCSMDVVLHCTAHWFQSAISGKF